MISEKSVEADDLWKERESEELILFWSCRINMPEWNKEEGCYEKEQEKKSAGDRTGAVYDDWAGL